MYSPFTLATRYLKYYLTASNGKGHGTHSPFVFDFITQVLNNRNHYYAYDSVEALREKLKLNREIIQVEDMGAGSGSTKSNARSIASIAKNAAKPKKYGQLLFRIANHYQPPTILELGTSLGITTSYLALGNQQANLVTIEGSKTVAERALENFANLGVNNVKLIQGNFDRILPKTVEALAQIDMAFVDGNHRKKPTLDYFEQLLPVMTESSVMVFDDIHWSAGMEEAWEQIRGDKRVMLSIDLFFLGLIFFDPAFKVKQHFTIRF